jgi:hypothetical protein
MRPYIAYIMLCVVSVCGSASDTKCNTREITSHTSYPFWAIVLGTLKQRWVYAFRWARVRLELPQRGCRSLQHAFAAKSVQSQVRL